MCHICEKCGKEFTKLYSYKRHINNKKPCIFERIDDLNTEKLKCPYCSKILSSTTRKKTHLITCKSRPSEMEELKEIIKIMSNKLDKQNGQIKELLNKESNLNNNTVNINQQQNNTFNIVPFGQEKFDYITDKEYKKIFRAGCQSMQTFIPLIYCNKNKPENMNVYIGNFNDESVRIFNGDGWIIEKKEDVLHNMYHAKRDYLELKFDDMYEDLSDNAKYFFEKFKECNAEPETIKIIQHDIKNILYANRMNVQKHPRKAKKTGHILQICDHDTIGDDDFIPEEPMFLA